MRLPLIIHRLLYKAGVITFVLLINTQIVACQEQTASSDNPSGQILLAQSQMQPAQQSQGTSASTSLASTTLVDEDQMTYRIDHYNEVAESGPVRGKNIYYYKCWVCHNSFAEDTGPQLNTLFERSVLLSGQPVNEQTVASKIRSGGPRMPGFLALTDKDMADLLAYLRSDECCWENGDETPLNPRYTAESNPWSGPMGLWGGPRGEVRAVSGQLLEGMKVQLIGPNGIRTTVFTDGQGQYEFPVLQTGAYTLRIATPIPYQAYRKEGVRVEGTNRLPEIVLTPVPEPDVGAKALPGALPPTPEIIAQLSGAEMLWNLPGTGQEKASFARGCGLACHTFQQVLRNRFTEEGWRAMVDRMLGYRQSILFFRRTGGYGHAEGEKDAEMIIKWLAKVRGPDSPEDAPLRQFPRMRGASTRVIITEYELPRRILGIHDAWGDAQGNIWYTSHRTAYAGVLDPRTGIIKEHKMPPSPGRMPGTHSVKVDNERGYAWFSENWARRYARLNMATGEIKTFMPTNVTGNFGLAPDGSIWGSNDETHSVERMDPETGEITASYPFKSPYPYQYAVSMDGHFWAGGSRPITGANTALMLDIRNGKMYETNSGDIMHSAAKGEFEPDGDNAWFGGRDGVLVELVNEIDENKGVHIRTYVPPTPYFPYTMFYTAMPARDGEVWGGVYHGRGFVRYNKNTDKWTEYENPEPSALSRNTWIDNSTDPVSVWYTDFNTGMIVRIQPRE